MKNIGIIAEYNPFHNGHVYHLNKCKELTNYDNAICILSGNFIQRGLPAMYNKWIRTQMALNSGINLVIELPTYYAINSAEFFAKGSIDIFNSLNILDHICFGVETNNISILNEIADILVTEPNEFSLLLKNGLNKGYSFAKARETALVTYTNNKQYGKIINNSNNILAIEYLKALKKSSSNIEPILINRTNCKYNSTNINSNICSATAIRELLSKEKITKQDISTLKKVVPITTFELILNNINNITSLKKFESQIIYMIRKMTLDELSNILEVNEGIESRLKKYSFETNNIYELINLVKSKRFTQTKIQRIIIHILLNMTKTEFNIINNANYKYIRVLGFDKKGEKLLKEISNKSKLPIITSVNKYTKITNNIMLEKDILSTNIYTEKYNLDYTQKIFKI